MTFVDYFPLFNLKMSNHLLILDYSSHSKRTIKNINNPTKTFIKDHTLPFGFNKYQDLSPSDFHIGRIMPLGLPYRTDISPNQTGLQETDFSLPPTAGGLGGRLTKFGKSSPHTRSSGGQAKVRSLKAGLVRAYIRPVWKSGGYNPACVEVRGA